MMEDDGGVEDDQGSGWCEVKKRHRCSSKLSIQKISTGSSNRSQPYSPRHQAAIHDEIGNAPGRQQYQPFNIKTDSATQLSVSAEGPASSSVPADQRTCCNDKGPIDKEIAPPTMRLMDAECETKAIHEVHVQENLDDIPKIKWGNLEDDVLTLPEFSGELNRSPETECSPGDGNLQEIGNAIKHDESVSDISTYTSLQEEKAIIKSEDVKQLFSGMLPLAMQEESLGGTQNDANEISSETTELRNSNQNDSSGNSKRCQSRDARTTHDEAHLDLGSANAAIDLYSSSPVEGIEETTLGGPQDESEDGVLHIHEVSDVTENRDMIVSLQDSTSIPHQKTGDGVPIGASTTAAMEDQSALQGNSIGGADAGEGESEESKERFRERLWCFLFENLNRAVDELYLLCELECDMEQMNEVILVLVEAASDFRELKSRVENFEITKRSPSHSSKDGMQMNVKAEHRRPHALSWEVRRMTTSPHRAEILSSSLEAFKKIQLERAGKHATNGVRDLRSMRSTQCGLGSLKVDPTARKPGIKFEKNTRNLDSDQQKTGIKKQNVEITKISKASPVQNGNLSAVKCKREPLGPISETEKQVPKKDKVSAENRVEKQSKTIDVVKRHNSIAEKEQEKGKHNTTPWKSMDAWKEKRNWEDILKSPVWTTSRVSHSPGLTRKGLERERVRVLHDKLMSPEKKKKSALDLKREAEEKHARAMRIRSQLENERVQRLQRTSEKLNRVNEWQAVRSLKLREGMYARQQRSESRHEAYLAQVARKAGDESHKVNEVRFITSLNEENKKLMLRQKLHDSEMRRAEKLQVIRTKQKEDMAREEAVMERRKLLEAEKLQRLAEIQRKKEEAQVRREEERKASSAAREARAVEQLRRREIRVKAQQEEAELLAQKLAERLHESEQRRKFYLEQIREKASMDFREQSSPLLRRSLNKEGQSRSITSSSVEDFQATSISGAVDSATGLASTTQQPSLKRRIKKIRQRLMALKHEFVEPSVGAENTGIGHRALVGAARVKIVRWLQDLQRLRQARKEGATSIGLIVGDMMKFFEGKDPELHATRQAGLLDFISSALPASHASKPEACQVTMYLLRLLRVSLSLSANRSYFLVQNLLPPIIPMLSACLENYIKIAASSTPGSNGMLPSKTSIENLESIAEVLDGFLWAVTAIVGHVHLDERQRQMQDGLMELIVAYQVIHRLRDLFALYDRPQVEGSPFPSCILLSLNLLAVLISRPGTISSIDWESSTSKIASVSLDWEPNLAKDIESVGNSSVINSTREIFSVIENAPVNESGQKSEEEKLVSRKASLPDISEGMTSDQECQKKISSVSVVLENVDSAPQICARISSGESQNIVTDEQSKPLISQKDDKSSMDNGEEKKRFDECTVGDKNISKKEASAKQSVVLLLSAIAETGLVSLPSLLTAVLLQANNKTSSEQASYVLPLNFEEVATGVLKILNNLALLDLSLLQSMLARSDLKMEFFHLMSFLLSHCTSKWKAVNDQVGLLLLECLLLLAYFALFHPGNQAVLRWGKSPTILHKVCDLPFIFFSDPELTPILAGTLVAACYGCHQNKGVVQQELSMEMLLSLLKSCRQGLLPVQSDSSFLDSSVANDPCDSNQTIAEMRKPQGDLLVRSNRRSSRVFSGKGNGASSNIKAHKTRIQKESRGLKTADEWLLKHNLPASEVSSTFMLHQRFPSAFLDKAEEFFSTEISS